MIEYISREEAKAKIREKFKNLADRIEVNEVLNSIAAADVAPVRHGRWEHEENWDTGFGVWVNVCSACGAITPVNVSRYKFCPNCGARMDGGGK